MKLTFFCDSPKELYERLFIPSGFKIYVFFCLSIYSLILKIYPVLSGFVSLFSLFQTKSEERGSLRKNKGSNLPSLSQKYKITLLQYIKKKCVGALNSSLNNSSKLGYFRTSHFHSYMPIPVLCF